MSSNFVIEMQIIPCDDIEHVFIIFIEAVFSTKL